MHQLHSAPGQKGGYLLEYKEANWCQLISPALKTFLVVH